ncbi:SET domain-containing protein [Calocera cornea HHB12733]|uniref:SET domain-containing protein n=1 Tax=Calocera cornea HHB12733 TaxID=1353952 RepID=A0A165FU73_9BASI|nr:SET domain-containing protein [Calocera cornea HHB12733]
MPLSSVGRNHPPPKEIIEWAECEGDPLEYAKKYNLAVNVPSLQTNNYSLPLNVPSLQMMLDSPGADRVSTFGYVIVGFGGADDEPYWDTVCITLGDNRPHLREHPGFYKYMSPELLKSNAANVEIVDMSDKGLGLVAKRDICGGTTFMAERPLITYRQGASLMVMRTFPKFVERMLREKESAYRALSNCKTKGDDATNLAGIMRTNSFGAEWPFDKAETQVVVFDWMSRANHSCMPNASFEWEHETFCGVFKSNRDIKKGEEITVAYIDLLLSAQQRRQELQQMYLFRCTCPACTLPRDQEKASDERRRTLRSRFRTGVDAHAKAPAAGFDNAYIRETLGMLEMEGLQGHKRDMLAKFVQLERDRIILAKINDRTRNLTRPAIKTSKQVGDAWDMGPVEDALSKALEGAKKAHSRTQPPGRRLSDLKKIIATKKAEDDTK